MTVTDDTRLRGRTRWSMAARCPRMAYYGLIGVEDDELSPAEARLQRRLFRRGRRIGDEVMDDFSEKYGEENIVREHASVWPDDGLPLGELHADGFVIPEKMAVEVKSSTSPASIVDSAITQLAGQIRWNPDAEIGCLAIADPTGMKETALLPILLTDELTERVESIAAQVVEASRTGEPPTRVCGKPSDARGKMCPFAGHCFKDWEQPERPKVETQEVVSLARQLYEVGRLKAMHNGNKADEAYVELEFDKGGADGALAALAKSKTTKGIEWLEKRVKLLLTEALGHAPEDFLHDPGEYEVGPLLLKRNRVERAGYEVKPSSYETLTVKRISDAPLLDGDSFGDEAPWDDDDLDKTLGEVLGG